MTRAGPGRPVLAERPALQAEATVDASAQRVRRWFLDLQEHPERYQFETHAGFAFTEGGFGQAGARFETCERFYGFQIKLRFTLGAVHNQRFNFRLVRPPLPVWGAFVIESLGSDQSRLLLQVGGTNHVGRMTLGLPLLRGAVQRQIQSEVDHIALSIQSSNP